MKKLILSFLLLVSAFMSSEAQARDVTLRWDKNNDADHYIVYYGNETETYTNQTNQINEIEFTVKNLSDERQYFSVKAFNRCGNSSDFSDEVYSRSVSNPLPVVEGFRIAKVIN